MRVCHLHLNRLNQPPWAIQATVHTMLGLSKLIQMSWAPFTLSNGEICLDTYHDMQCSFLLGSVELFQVRDKFQQMLMLQLTSAFLYHKTVSTYMQM